MAAKPKPRVKVPRKVARGEVFQVKSLISHRMESGQRKDKKTGKKIPKKIINRFIARFNGREVFSADWYPAISANPYMAFYLRATESGTLELVWFDDDGSEYRKSSKIQVT